MQVVQYVFSGSAFKDRSYRKNVFSGGASKESCRRNCLAEVLSRIGDAGRVCVSGGACMEESCRAFV